MPDRFLVTGALGCIGAWAVHELLAEGCEVTVLDPGASDHRLRYLLDERARAAVRVEPADIADRAAVADVFAAARPTHVVHLAALQVPFCRADPPLGAAVNVLGTINVFEAAADAGLETPLV